MKKYIIALLGAIAITGCSSEQIEEVQKEAPLRPVSYVISKSKDTEVSREFSGVVRASTESNLSFRIPGTITEKYVKLGDRVEKGQILAQLDRLDYEVKYQTALAGLEQANAALVRDKADFERIQRLYFNDNVSKAEYDKALALFRSSEAEVRAKRKSAEYEKLQLSYATLVAPADGSVAREMTEVNETVAAGTEVFLLSLSGDLEVEFFIPDSLINQISLGEEVTVVTHSGRRIETAGEIVRVGDVSTGFGGTFPVRARLLNGVSEIRSGMAAQVGLSFSVAQREIILLPLHSVVTNTSGDKFVFVVEDEDKGVGTVNKTIVETGKVTGEGIEITKGLAGGEVVITAGMSQVTLGEQVLVPPREVK